ncbi:MULTISPECIES: SepM family pheromone-processing serine protease [Bacillus]|uniref:SepM family pheromone-processing serine protease n=1 Tax=Bacillus TaxID=1386 RepID=UPI000318F8C4|nr:MULTISPECIES: SepM family pheromone-processing serine protease [Bacillus]
MKRNRFLKGLFIVVCIILLGGYFIPMPYYISKPGMAKELAPIIEVDGGKEEKGSLMLTTIQMGKANIFSYFISDFKDFWKVYPEEDIKIKGESDEEYEVRQLHMMDDSKEQAIMSAFKAANKPYEKIYKGIYVYQVVKGMPAEKKLHAGDRITKIDQQTIQSSDQFMKYVAKKKKGDLVNLEVMRDGKTLREDIELASIPDSGKIGIGIALVDDYDVKTNPKVSIDSSQIGGPSAGLMFSLEIYNQLVKEDITKGYKIAGTGTIDSEGHVGAIGGIDQKVVAADKNGAQIFFAPNENGKKNSNYNVAKKAAEKIKTKMKIIPVDTMDDALEYLYNISDKE